MTHLRKGDYVVVPVHVSMAQALVAKHHYAKGGSLTAVYVHGLFHKDNPLECLGVAWWLPPTRVAAEAAWGGDFRDVLSLTRLVIVPDMPTNAASFLLGRSIRLITKGGRFRCLLTYADERQGHTGQIYRATNWEYAGMTEASPVFLDSEGRMRACKATKNRTRAEMESLGYELVGHSRKHRFRLVLPPLKHGVQQMEFSLEC